MTRPSKDRQPAAARGEVPEGVGVTLAVGAAAARDVCEVGATGGGGDIIVEGGALAGGLPVRLVLHLWQLVLPEAFARPQTGHLIGLIGSPRAGRSDRSRQCSTAECKQTIGERHYFGVYKNGSSHDARMEPLLLSCLEDVHCSTVHSPTGTPSAKQFYHQWGCPSKLRLGGS